MGLFKKSEKKEEKPQDKSIVPSLPELPKLPTINKLPELPSLPNVDLVKEPIEAPTEKLSQLPSFPNNPLGNKFSQYSIKEAIAGKKEVDEVEVDEFPEEEIQMIQKPLIKRTVKEDLDTDSYTTPVSSNFNIKTKEIEPLFIRIDKFEEGSETFNEVKKQVIEIEKFFNDLKKVKESEEKELKLFEDELKEIKGKIESIDKNIFSKLD